MVSQPGCLACTVPDGKTMWLARTAHLMVTKRGKKRSWVKYFYCSTCFSLSQQASPVCAVLIFLDVWLFL